MCNLYTKKAMVQETADPFGARTERGYNVAAEVYPGYPGIAFSEHESARVLQSTTQWAPVVQIPTNGSYPPLVAGNLLIC